MLQRWHLCHSCTTPLETLVYRVLKKPTATVEMESSFPNLQVGDVVCVHGEVTSLTKWPLAQIEEVHPGIDGKVRLLP